MSFYKYIYSFTLTLVYILSALETWRGDVALRSIHISLTPAHPTFSNCTVLSSIIANSYRETSFWEKSQEYNELYKKNRSAGHNIS